MQDGILYDKAQRTVKLVPFGYTGDVALPDTVTEVGGYAFSMLKNIGKVTASGVEAIGTGAFLGCEGESIQLGTSVKTVGDLAFSGLPNMSLPAAR